MEIIRGITNIRPKHRGCVLTIGNFDGVHQGHQNLLSQLLAKSHQLNLPATAIIFEPQPNEFFNQEACLTRLMTLREKIEALSRQGLDRVLCIRFTEKIARLTSEAFVHDILFEKLATKYVLVGDDFKFGYKRLGDFVLLKRLGEKYFFEAAHLPTFKLLGKRVSSTRIRQLLEQGEVEQANYLLGQSFTVKGRVIEGDKIGRQLGFPTANIHFEPKKVPLSGIFIVEMLGIDNKPLPGVASIGTRPTVNLSAEKTFEVHLLNFDQNIYGQLVAVRFLKKVRDELAFPDLIALKEQIKLDVELAKNFFTHHRRRV